MERSEKAEPQSGSAPSSPLSRHARAAWARWALGLTPALMLAILLIRPVWDVDIFWQLRLGELILDAGRPITREPFAATHLGEPLPALAWLGQAMFAAVRYASGWTGLRLFDALCWCGGFWLVAAACWRRGASAGSLAVALALCFLAALPAASIRPQTFGALCFGTLLALLKLHWEPWRTAVAGTALLLLWQNLHPSVSIAVVALAAHAAAGWLVWWRDRYEQKPWAATILMSVAFASMFATPDGIGILATAARNAQASMAVGASEWLPLWIPANHTNAIPVIVVALIAVRSAWRRPRRISWPDLAMMLTLLAATLTAYRFVLFWALASVPVIAAGHSRPKSALAPILGIAVPALLVVTMALPLLWPTHFSPNLPMAAVARLDQTAVRGTIFTEPEFAGVLIDTGYPRWLVSYDGRYYRYTDDEWGRYGEILGGTIRLKRIERMYRPAAFVLRPSHSTPLCRELDRPGSGWRRIYQDEGAAVWIPA